MSVLDRRLAALAEAVELADGRLDSQAVEDARAVTRRAGERLGLGVEATVVALAGPTGAGKSSLFNALAGADVAVTGRRRPTTSAAAAAVWGDVGGELLDWLEVRRRHAIDAGRLAGLVLLDLPDYDSVETSHRLEVERLIGVVDLVVWVLDPQKYADAALHERYLRGLAAYRETMVVVLNQADLLSTEELAACRADLGRLLEDDGLAGLPVLAASARTGAGLDALRGLLEERVRAREAAAARLAADVTAAVERLAAECGERAPGEVRSTDRDRLLAALAQAAGLPTVVGAVRASHRRRGALATGWPPVRWVRRLRRDPFRRLRLPDRPAAEGRTNLAGPTSVQRAQVSRALRAVAAGATERLPDPWPTLARRAATAREDELADRLDRAVAGADLHMARPRWWRLADLIQRVLAFTAGAGALWLLALGVLGYLQLEDVLPVPHVGRLPLPTVLLLGGALAGVLLSLLAGAVTRLGARRRARAAERSLRHRVAEVADELAVAPLEAELEAYQGLCSALAAAAPERRRGLFRRRGGERGVPIATAR